MFSNRISSVFFASAFVLLLGACLLLPTSMAYANDHMVVGDLNCDGTVNVFDALQVIGIVLGLAQPVACEDPEICEECEEVEVVRNCWQSAFCWASADAWGTELPVSQSGPATQEECHAVEGSTDWYDWAIGDYLVSGSDWGFQEGSLVEMQYPGMTLTSLLCE